MKLKTLVQEEAFVQECCRKVSTAFYSLKVDNVKTNISHVGMADNSEILSASGSSCSKLTMSLVNVSLKFQMLISEIHQYFLLKKCEKLLQCKSFSHIFNQKYQCIWL